MAKRKKCLSIVCWDDVPFPVSWADDRELVALRAENAELREKVGTVVDARAFSFVIPETLFSALLLCRSVLGVLLRPLWVYADSEACSLYE